MLISALLSLALVALSAFVHFQTLQWMNDRLQRTTLIARRARVLIAVLGAMGSHVCQIALFGLTYYLLRGEHGGGALGGHFRDAFTSYLYFSAETYTSLGLGDIYPLGELRMLAGIEALTGLLMISWTASFTYLEMSRYWDVR